MAGWRLPPTHSKVVHAVTAALYNRFNTPLTSIKQELLKLCTNQAFAYYHKITTLHAKLCHHSGAGEECIAFSETTSYSVITALGLEWILAKIKEWSLIMICPKQKMPKITDLRCD